MFDYKIHIVLVRSLYASNIGAVSRAMSNMGAHRLILVGCACEVDYSAQLSAATGQEGLQGRTEYKSWDEFLANEPGGLRVALTARDGRARAVHDLRSALTAIKAMPQFETKDSEQPTHDVYLIFGPEDHGLSLEDLEHCHYGCSLPTYGKNWSLNLAQACLLALYILRDTWGGVRTTLDGQDRPREAKISQDVARQNLLPDKTIKTWLETLGFDLTKRRINAFTVLRRILLHNVPTPQELRMLETVLQQTIRKLKEGKANSPSNVAVESEAPEDI